MISKAICLDWHHVSLMAQSVHFKKRCVFGHITNSMGGLEIRSIGIRRACGIIGLINLAYNIVRSVQLQGA